MTQLLCFNQQLLLWEQQSVETYSNNYNILAMRDTHGVNIAQVFPWSCPVLCS